MQMSQGLEELGGSCDKCNDLRSQETCNAANLPV